MLGNEMGSCLELNLTMDNHKLHNKYELTKN